jgi:hypothetical protein
MPEEYYQTRRGKKVLIHAGRDAADKAFAFFDEDTIVVSDPTGTISIMVAKDFGIGIQGPLSLLQNPEEIRVAGLWKVNPLVITALPSTLYTPIPWLRPSIPTSYTELIKGLAEVSALI